MEYQYIERIKGDDKQEYARQKALEESDREFNLFTKSISAGEARLLKRHIEEAQAEERHAQAEALRKAQLMLEQPPAWLVRAKSMRRLPVAFTGWETFERYEKRLRIVRALAAMEADYHAALNRLDQQRAKECLTHIANMQQQLLEAVEAPEPLYQLGRNY